MHKKDNSVKMQKFAISFIVLLGSNVRNTNTHRI